MFDSNWDDVNQGMQVIRSMGVSNAHPHSIRGDDGKEASITTAAELISIVESTEVEDDVKEFAKQAVLTIAHLCSTQGLTDLLKTV